MKKLWNKIWTYIKVEFGYLSPCCHAETCEDAWYRDICSNCEKRIR